MKLWCVNEIFSKSKLICRPKNQKNYFQNEINKANFTYIFLYLLDIKNALYFLWLMLLLKYRVIEKKGQKLQDCYVTLKCFLSINNHNFLVVWIYVHRFWDGINMVHNGAFPWESLGDLSRCQDQADAHQDVLHQSHHRDHVAYCYFPGMFAFVGSQWLCLWGIKIVKMLCLLSCLFR